MQASSAARQGSDGSDDSSLGAYITTRSDRRRCLQEYLPFRFPTS